MTISQPTNPLRIAILEADHPLDRTADKFGTYGGVFSSLLRKGATELSWDSEKDLDITKWDVECLQLFPSSLDNIDVILITGSRANAFDNTPWIVRLVDYIREVLTTQSRVRVIGVCFGHQIIARALGCTVTRSEAGWEASVVTVPLNNDGLKLFEGKETLRIFQMHRDIVTDLPPDTVNLGSTDRCAIQGMFSPKRFVSVQGHPEFTNEIVSEILEARREAGIFTDEEFKDMMGRVENEHDGVIVAKAFLKFALEGVQV